MSVRSAMPYLRFALCKFGVAKSRQQFRSESVPNHYVAFIRLPAALKTPLKDFFVGSALEEALAKIVIVDAQKIATSAIKRPRRAEVLVIILVQLAPRVQPNLVQHAREIHHASRHLFRAFWIGAHAGVNRIPTTSAIFPVFPI
jgi:hypothetical protein